MLDERALSARDLFRRILDLCKSDPGLMAAFGDMRRDARKLSSPISVDITSRCNLFCEGCYYFEGDQQAMRDEEDITKWRDYFAAQGRKGVQFLYIGGAEAALSPDRIRAAADHIPHGIIAANGTIKIAKSIPYRIAVSVWGDADTSTRLRGGGTFWKALRNYGDDPRAMFVYTISRQNLDQLPGVARIMQSEDVKLTFNMYSPTERYADRLAKRLGNDSKFFRFSTAEDNLCFTAQDLIKCRDIVDALSDEYPDTIVYPKPYNREITQGRPLFEMEADTGYASNCAGRHNGTHHTILSTLEQSQAKCCMPNLDCSDCRLLASYLPSRLMPRSQDALSVETVRDWLNITRYWSWFFLNRPYRGLVG